jgi:hypothetical protein
MAHVPLGPSPDLNNSFGTQTRPTGGPRVSFTAADVVHAAMPSIGCCMESIVLSFFLSFFAGYACAADLHIHRGCYACAVS